MKRWTLWTSGLLCFCAGSLYGWSALIRPLQAAYDVSMAQSGLIFSLAIVSFTCAIIISPHVLRHWRPRHRLALFGTLAAASICGAAVAPSYLAFVLFFSGGFGAMSGALYLTTLGVAATSSHQKIATPVMVACFGAGGAVFGPIWRVMDAKGWGLSGLYLVVAGLLGASALVLARPRDAGHEPTRSPPASPKPTPRSTFDQRFVLIWLVFASGSFGGLMILGLAARMLDTAGLSVALSSMALAGIAIANTVGRASVAGFQHVMQEQNCLLIALTFSGIGIICATTQAGLAPGLVMIAVGYGIIAATIPTITCTVFGPTAFQPLFAVMMTAWGLAGFIAPWVSGAIYDQTGSFGGAILLAAAMLATCAVLTWRLRQLLRAH